MISDNAWYWRYPSCVILLNIWFVFTVTRRHKELFQCLCCDSSTIYAIQYIITMVLIVASSVNVSKKKSYKRAHTQTLHITSIICKWFHRAVVLPFVRQQSNTLEFLLWEKSAFMMFSYQCYCCCCCCCFGFKYFYIKTMRYDGE